MLPCFTRAGGSLKVGRGGRYGRRFQRSSDVRAGVQQPDAFRSRRLRLRGLGPDPVRHRRHVLPRAMRLPISAAEERVADGLQRRRPRRRVPLRERLRRLQGALREDRAPDGRAPRAQAPLGRLSQSLHRRSVGREHRSRRREHAYLLARRQDARAQRGRAAVSHRSRARSRRSAAGTSTASGRPRACRRIRRSIR